VALNPTLSAKIDALASAQVHAGRTVGLEVGVVEDGRLVYARGFGFANLSPHAPMTPDTEFYVGGLTMQFTAAAILLLAQDGKLHLEDRVARFVPEFRLAANVTVGQLLTQTSGLPQVTHVPGISPDFTHSVKLADLFTALDRRAATPAPTGIYENNPLNYLVAGLIVERAGGVPLSDYLQQHIFIPLVMNHSFLAGDSGIAPQHAVGYTRNGRGFRVAPAWDPSWLGGNAGLVSTVYDLAKWDVEMPILLRVDAMRTMLTPSAKNGATNYGMGWVIDRRGGKDFVWSNGEISGYRAMSALLPEQHIGVIVLSNADSLHGGPVTVPEELGAEILDVLVPPTATHLDNATVARAKEWLERLASRRIDRAEITPAFSAYLTDDLIAKENVAALGPLQSIVPVSSETEADGDTRYVFLVRFPHARYHYTFEVAPDGKVDGLQLSA
jgi:CubicO group peptidase (beta-lactamase class C family)